MNKDRNKIDIEEMKLLMEKEGYNIQEVATLFNTTKEAVRVAYLNKTGRSITTLKKYLLIKFWIKKLKSLGIEVDSKNINHEKIKETTYGSFTFERKEK